MSELTERLLGYAKDGEADAHDMMAAVTEIEDLQSENADLHKKCDLLVDACWTFGRYANLNPDRIQRDIDRCLGELPTK